MLVFSNNLCAALLAEITRAFEREHPNHYLGRTAMQKLAYFCQATGVPIPCSFEIYNYGPYSDEVKFAVDSLVADEVIEDRSNNPARYSNYRLSNQNPEFRQDINDVVARCAGQINRVVGALGRFGPDQLELVATLHFVAAQRRARTGKITKDDVIRDFRAVKGDKFGMGDIELWYAALNNGGLF